MSDHNPGLGNIYKLKFLCVVLGHFQFLLVVVSRLFDRVVVYDAIVCIMMSKKVHHKMRF